LRIAYVGVFQFPDDDAGASRVLGIGRALREQGHTVVYFGISNHATDNADKRIVNDDNLFYAGFRYHLPYPAVVGFTQRIRRQFSIYTGSFLFDRLVAEETRHGPIDAVIAYQSSSVVILLLQRWCRKRGIPLICDTVEWYDRSHVMGGRFGPLALDSELRMRKIQHKCDGIIAISSYLEKYYRNTSSIPVVRIPPLLDLLDNKLPKRSNKLSSGRLSLVFAGNAGKKDLVINAIRGLAMLGEQAKLCEIAMIGPSSGELRKSLGADADFLMKLSGSLLFTGRRPHQEALNNVAQADFSILLRPDARFAHAGFPTKLVESLGMSVPVICNLTSDIGMYVHDGQAGIGVNDCSPAAFADGVQRALSLSVDERMAMRRRARKCAEDNFDYRNWVKPMREFMDMVVLKGRTNRATNQ